MKKLLLLTLGCLLSLSLVTAQSIPVNPNQTDSLGQKQGPWTRLYDANWNPVSDTAQVEYYRVLTYQDGKPTGQVIDYYRDGQAQMVADSVISEAPETYQGAVTFYRPDGSKETLRRYEQGQLVEEIFYNPDGSLAEENWQSLNSQGMQAYQAGDYPQVQVYWEKAKVQAEKEFGQESQNYATACNNLAVLYYAQGLYRQAEPLYLEAKEITKKVLGKNHPDYAQSCNNLAALYEAQGLYRQAEPLYQEAKEITEKVLGKDHPYYATSLSNLARLYHTQGLYRQAEALYQEAKEIQEKVLGKDHPNYASSCNNLAELYRVLGLYRQAEPLYQEAKEIIEKVLGKDHPDYALSCNNLARLYWNQSDYAQASPLLREASQVLIGQTQENFAHLSEKEKELFFKTFNYYFEIYNSFTLQAHPQIPSLTAWIYDNSLATKGLLFQSSQKMRRRILAGGDSTLIQKFQTWQNQREYLAHVYTLTKEEKERQGIQLDSLEQAANALEKELSQKSQLFAQVSDTSRYSWRDVQRKLQPSEAALEIIRTRYYDKEWTDSVFYLALLVKPDTKEQPELIILPQGNDLEGKYLAAYRNHIQAQSRDQNSYRQYWQPLAESLGDVQKVYLSADGVYHQINLNTLQNPETGKYLLEEIDIELVSNTEQLARPERSATQTQSALLLGRPAYQLEAQQHQQAIQSYQSRRSSGSEAQSAGFYTLSEEMARLNFADLPGTGDEVQQIHQALRAEGWRAQLYLEEKALEEVIKAAQNPRVLHIATHGFFFENPRAKRFTDSTQSQVSRDLLDRGGLDARNAPPLRRNPMLRSGLVLTGVSTYAQSKEKYQTEDGLLTAYEAMSLDLDSTELVVLSACETGRGDIQNGEGIYGLQRGFQQAGAKAVLMSLWSVDDTATQELMTEFYTQWLSGKSKREAFKLAQQKLKAEKPEPYYWGAFVLVGE